MQRRSSSLLFFLPLWVAACGGGSSGPSVSATGTVDNQPVPTTDAIGKRATYTQGSSSVTTLSVLFANQSGLCGAPPDNMPADLVTFGISVAVASASVQTGTYDLTDPNAVVSARFAVTGSNGTPVSGDDDATAGSITFTGIDSSALDGSFSFTFSDGSVSGMFHAPICSS